MMLACTVLVRLKKANRSNIFDMDTLVFEVVRINERGAGFASGVLASERDGLVAIADLNEEAAQDMWMRRVGTSGKITSLCSVIPKRMQL